MPLPSPPLIEQFAHVRAGFLNLRDGKRLRYAIFDPATPPHGTILVTPGRREYIEKKYSELGPEFLVRGFRLIFMEWRGQGLSSRWLDGSKRQRDHAPDFSQHIDDLNELYTAVIQPNLVGPLILNGHSMGGHFLLRWLTERSDLPIAGVIVTAPMLALAGSFAHASAHFLSWTSSKLGYGTDYAPLQHDYNDDDRAFAGNPLTHDPDRFTIIDRYFTAYPELAVGGVTWEWLHAAVKSMELTQRRSRLERIACPVLAMTGSEDIVTPAEETARSLKMIPKAETIIIPGARHDLMNEITPCRDEAWRQIDGFLKRIII